MALQHHFMLGFKTHRALLLAACSLAASVAVSAQTSESVQSHTLTPVTAATAEPPSSGKPRLRQVDAAFARTDNNQDGKLSRAEAEHLPAIALRFDQLDTNKDQFLSREEFDNALKP